MNDPFLSVLLDVTWAKGQIYRAYTILLDPPAYELVSASVSNHDSKRVSPTHLKKKKYRRSISKKSFATSKGVYGPTKITDDLWDIALQYKPQNASINQMMLGIIRLNPNAFIHGNINSLKKGVTLKLPTTQTVLLIDKKTVQSEVKAHQAAWKHKESIMHVADLSTLPNVIEPKINVFNEDKNMNIMKDAEPPVEVVSDNNDSMNINPDKSHKNSTKEKITPQTDHGTVEKIRDAPVLPEISEKDKLKLNITKTVEKEHFFDDYITIPPVLKKIVKPYKNADKTQGEMVLEEKDQNIASSLKQNVEPSTQSLNAEVAVAVSAIEAVKESNQLLRQQVEGLLKQNALLKQQVTVLSNQDEKVRKKIDLLIKVVEKDYSMSADGQLIRKDGVKQGSETINSSYSITELLGLLSILILLAVGGTFIFIFFKQKDKKEAKVVDDEMMALYNKENIGGELAQAGEAASASSETPVKQYNQAVISVSEDVENQETTPKSTTGHFETKVLKKSADTNDATKTPMIENADLEATSQLAINMPDKVEPNSIPESNSPPNDTDQKSEFDLLDLEFEYTGNKSSENKQTSMSADDKECSEIDSNKNKTEKNEVAPSKENEFDLLDIEFEYTAIAEPDLAVVNKPVEALPLDDEKKTSDSVPKADILSLDGEEAVECQPSQGKAQMEIIESPPTPVNVSKQIALAETYIAMEDWQSANESLEMVIQNGNKAQVEKAKRLKNKLP